MFCKMHNLCIEQKVENNHNFSSKNDLFYSHEILQFIALTCLRNRNVKVGHKVTVCASPGVSSKGNSGYRNSSPGVSSKGNSGYRNYVNIIRAATTT